MSNLYPYSGVAVFPQDQLINGEQRNTKAGAEIRVYDSLDNLVTTFVNSAGDGGATVRTTDANGAFSFYVASGTYRVNFDQSTDISVTIGAGVNLSDVAISGNLTDLISGVFNIEDYGAVADNLTDNKAAIDTAISDLSANGGGTLFIPPSGVFRTSGSHEVPSNCAVVGEGYNSCLKGFYNAGSNSSTAVFSTTTDNFPEIQHENISFKNFRIEGVWDESFKETNNNSTVVFTGIRNFIMENCWIRNADYGSFVINGGIDAHVRNCHFYNSARDMCRLWNVENSSVVGNTFYRNDDDCISINMAGFAPVSGRPREGIVVANNYLQDTGGIRMQSSKNCTITGNVLKLTKGNASITVEAITFAGVRESNNHNVIIANNTIADTIERTLAKSQNNSAFSNLRTAIKITAGEWSKWGLDFDEAYEYYNTDRGSTGGPVPDGQNDSPVAPMRVSEGIIVANNIVKRTLPAVTNYSDWGYGKMFTRFKDTGEASGYIVDGEADPQILDVHLEARPLEIRDGLHNSVIIGNSFEGAGKQCIQFRDDNRTATDFTLRGVLIKDNILRDFTENGIHFNGSFSGTTQDMVIGGNTVDGDPFFKSTGRATVGGDPTGGFTSVSNLRGIGASGVKGIVLTNNIFKNCSQAWSLDSDTCVVEDNFLVGEPDATNPFAFSSSNLGIGVYPAAAGVEFNLIHEVSDPRQPNYGERLVQPKKSFGAETIPSGGFYFRGQFIASRSYNISGSQKILIGHKRMTNGTSHVLGTDWQPLYASITA